MGRNPSKNKGKNHPVDSVSWYDAKEFCWRLNKLYADKLPEGYRFDLPTEAQWEYACRAGTDTDLNNGKDLRLRNGTFTDLNELGWYRENSGRATRDDIPLNLVRIFRGSFLMGIPEGQLGGWCDETQHRVTLTRGFGLGKYPVNRKQYAVVTCEDPLDIEGLIVLWGP